MLQHYELPTRLLDWTESALVALYFAVADEGAQPCVWILAPGILNKKSVNDERVVAPGGQFTRHWLPIESADDDGCSDSVISKFDYHGTSYTNADPIAIFPVRMNARIIAQHGTFTVHGVTRTPIDELLIPNEPTSGLAVVEIDPNARLRLCRDLEFCGVRKHILFPELPMLSQDIKARLGIQP